MSIKTFLRSSDLELGLGVEVKPDTGAFVPDPGPGYWNRNYDVATGSYTPTHRVAYDRVFLVRSEATGRCPSGPCGNREVWVLVQDGIPLSAHARERMAERGISEEEVRDALTKGVSHGPMSRKWRKVVVQVAKNTGDGWVVATTYRAKR